MSRLRFFRRLAMFSVCAIFASDARAASVRLRIVTYNIEADINGFTTPRPGLVTPYNNSTNVLLGGVLEGIGEEMLGNDSHAQPLDIIALQETTSNSGTVQPIVTGLNAFYGTPGRYALSTFQATESNNNPGTGNGPNAIIYNTATVQLLASVPVLPAGGTSKLGSSSGEYREVMRYEFAPAGVTPSTLNEFYIYVSHYKSGTAASDLTSRAGEAVIIRNDEAANLPADARVLYVGDYNVTTSGEASYITMLATNSPGGIKQGQGFDFSNTAGATNINWGTASLLSLKTESATSLRYRDDFEIMTSNVFFGTVDGFSLVPNTYHVFGNNGSTLYQGSVSNTDTALNNSLIAGAPITARMLYSDLASGSDHLPVVADYTVAISPATVLFYGAPAYGGSPLSVFFADSSGGDFTNWFWDFGDGVTTNGPASEVTHIYTNVGAYTIKEIATGPLGSATNTQINLIVVLTPYQAWESQNFACTNCPDGAPNADPDGTGQNNYFKFIAGLPPLDTNAVFTLQPAPATNQSSNPTITFGPVVAGRTYTPQFATNLNSSTWQPLTNLTLFAFRNQPTITFTDTNASTSPRFYRLNISLTP